VRRVGDEMASPQVENGYTKIANELLDAIVRFDFSKLELRIILYILRKTYGFNKLEDDMTVQQIATATGIDRSNASRALRSLIGGGSVLFRHGKFGKILKINKNYDQWCRVKTTRPCQNNTPDRVKTTRSPVLKQHTQKTTPKDNSKKDSCANGVDGFAEFWSAYPKKRSKGQAERTWIKIHPDEKIRSVIAEALVLAKRSRDWKREGGQFIPYPATWLNARGWEDEIQESQGREFVA